MRQDGQPMALVTADGKVYLITGGLAANMNAKIIPHVPHTVEITGDVTTQGRQEDDQRHQPEDDFEVDAHVAKGPGICRGLFLILTCINELVQ